MTTYKQIVMPSWFCRIVHRILSSHYPIRDGWYECTICKTEWPTQKAK